MGRSVALYRSFDLGKMSDFYAMAKIGDIGDDLQGHLCGMGAGIL
jgi:hypothetical protein